MKIMMEGPINYTCNSSLYHIRIGNLFHLSQYLNFLEQPCDATPITSFFIRPFLDRRNPSIL